MEEQGWRQEPDNAEVFFGNQKKQVTLEGRRPVIRQASDLVGPGIAAQAVAITDFNDLLATYNGYFSALRTAFGAPNDDEDFVGFTVNDASLGGFQTFMGMGDYGPALGHTHRRRFRRNPSDVTSILWESWVDLELDSGPPIGTMYHWPSSVAPARHLICDGSTFSGVTYPDLATVLGGTTLPDVRDRALYGLGTAWTLFGNDGLAAGSRTKTMDHNHALVAGTAGAHTHSGTTGSPSDTVSRSDGLGTAAHPAHTHGFTTSSDGAHSHGGTTLSLPGDGPVLRGLGVNIIIRAL